MTLARGFIVGLAVTECWKAARAIGLDPHAPPRFGLGEYSSQLLLRSNNNETANLRDPDAASHALARVPSSRGSTSSRALVGVLHSIHYFSAAVRLREVRSARCGQNNSI